jgi:CAAX protease family protein
MPWDIWLIFLVLGILVPWRGRVRLRELLAKPRVSERERISLYLSTIAFQWVAAGAAAWRAWAHGFGLSELGVVSATSSWAVGIVAISGAAGIAVLQWLNLQRLGRTARTPEVLRAIAERILPQSRREFGPFLGLAFTAGMCEEFLYRGFAMAAFGRAGLPAWAVVAVTSGLFGLAHLYQGRGGLLGTTLLGLLFGSVRIAYHSLVPVILWHVAVDVIAGIGGPRYLRPVKAAAPAVSAFES